MAHLFRTSPPDAGRSPSASLRTWRGASCATSGYLFPITSWLGARSSHADLTSPETTGLVLVLPGIEGCSSLTMGIVRGLRDAGLSTSIVTHDWTTGVWPLFLYHLRSRRRNRLKAAAIAERIVEYQTNWPGRPVHLVGHSGGAALAVWILEMLPPHCQVETAVLLAPALSPGYNLSSALRHTVRGIWNFHSFFDGIYLAAGTLLFGTLEGKHCVAAGNRGFSVPRDLPNEDQSLYVSKLHQHRYSLSMLGRFHFGGHFGWANRVFVAETIAPILLGQDYLAKNCD